MRAQILYVSVLCRLGVASARGNRQAHEEQLLCHRISDQRRSLELKFVHRRGQKCFGSFNGEFVTNSSCHAISVWAFVGVLALMQMFCIRFLNILLDFKHRVLAFTA